MATLNRPTGFTFDPQNKTFTRHKGDDATSCRLVFASEDGNEKIKAINPDDASAETITFTVEDTDPDLTGLDGEVRHVELVALDNNGASSLPVSPNLQDQKLTANAEDGLKNIYKGIKTTPGDSGTDVHDGAVEVKEDGSLVNDDTTAESPAARNLRYAVVAGSRQPQNPEQRLIQP